jgi:hypothetical protein
MNWPEVQGKFLAGTARGKGTEADALNDAALFSAMRRAGFVAATEGPDPVSEAGAEDLPEMVAGTDDLRRCLDEGRALVEEWCREATRRGWRVPNALLPELINFAAKHSESRTAIRPVLGQRGLWLAALNPQWAPSFSVEPEIDADEARRLWEEGTRAERRGILAALTTRDPALRRELVESSWKQEPAKTRLEFIEAFEERVWPEDEGFLIRCLTDRSMDVRFAASQLLGLLPQADTADEIFALAQEFVKIGSPTKVIAPEIDDARFDRFGIASQKGAATVDERFSRLMRLISLVHPARWLQPEQSYSELIRRIESGPGGKAFREGLALATRFYRDTQAAETLVRGGDLNHEGHLIHLLSRPAQERIAMRVWDASSQSSLWRFLTFAITNLPWSTEFTRAFHEIVRGEIAKPKSRLSPYYLREAAYVMAPFFPWTPPPDAPEHWRSALEEWHRILEFRRSMYSTFERSSKP